MRRLRGRQTFRVPVGGSLDPLSGAVGSGAPERLVVAVISLHAPTGGAAAVETRGFWGFVWTVWGVLSSHWLNLQLGSQHDGSSPGEDHTWAETSPGRRPHLGEGLTWLSQVEKKPLQQVQYNIDFISSLKLNMK